MLCAAFEIASSLKKDLPSLDHLLHLGKQPASTVGVQAWRVSTAEVLHHLDSYILECSDHLDCCYTWTISCMTHHVNRCECAYGDVAAHVGTVTLSGEQMPPQKVQEIRQFRGSLVL